MPSSEKVRPLLVREATRANVQAINHDLDPANRRATLRSWVEREYPENNEATWFELAGAAGAGLAIYALFALAAAPGCGDAAIAAAYSAYFPWTSAVATMLDSYVDQVEDTANGDHVYVAYYSTPQLAEQRISLLIQRTLAEARALPDSERHMLIAACMVAMYLSKDSARTGETRETTMHLAAAGGPLTEFLLPILRLWRTAYAQRST
jgi:tetraprenyl-beta-curcumene synthase